MNSSESNLPSAEVPLACRDLRCKEMFEQSPEDDAFASGQYWCTRTHEAFGPDGEPCNRQQCCEGRGCYRVT